MKTLGMGISKGYKYKIGEVVYLKHDPEQLPRMVVCIMVYATFVQYLLQLGSDNSTHFEYEITTDRNILLNLN
jgi:hypothetical protein